MTKSTGNNPGTEPAAPFPEAPDELHELKGRLWIPLRGEWRGVTGKPEETVRQHFIRHLHDHYGYALGQMDQERRTMHGRRSPRADIVIWETQEAKAANRTGDRVQDRERRYRHPGLLPGRELRPRRRLRVLRRT